MTERVRSQVQASEMKFSQNIKEVMLFSNAHRSVIRKSRNIKPLLFRIEGSQGK